MAWSISISAEGWQDIYEACHQCEKQYLWDAINEVFSQENSTPLSGQLFNKIAHDCLADRVYQAIIETNTCDLGGFKYWIDKEGCYKVSLPSPFRP